MTRLSAFLALTAAMTACRSGAAYAPPDVAVPAEWAETQTSSGGAGDSMWWRAFGDRQLDSLVERAVRGNLDLAIAKARIREARGLRDVAAGGRYPELDARASATRTKISGNSPFLEGPPGTGSPGTGSPGPPGTRFNLFDVGFDARWEIDLFGATQSRIDAAQAGADAADAARRDVAVTLIGEVARAYVELRGTQRLDELTREQVRIETESLALVRDRFAHDIATDFDVARAQAQLAATSALAPRLDETRVRAVHRLSLLLGESPDALAKELAEPSPLPTAPAGVAAGVPSEMVRRRPDIRRAERVLAQATSSSAAAVADLFPRIVLMGSLGQQSTHLGDLTDAASRTWSIGPSLSWPIFDAGSAQARVRVEDSRRDAALLEYRRAVLEALGEVEDGLVAVARERERSQRLTEAADAGRRALADATRLEKRGLVDYLAVLDAQRTHLAAETDEVRSEMSLVSDVVALYKALGGGWEIADESR